MEMADYKQHTPYNVPAIILTPDKNEKTKGVNTKKYKETGMFFCSFRTFGGTEKTVNNLLAVENTAVIETWYRPDITSDCAIAVDGVKYEIISPPENINMRNQVMKFKVRAIKGGV